MFLPSGTRIFFIRTHTLFLIILLAHIVYKQCYFFHVIFFSTMLHCQMKNMGCNCKIYQCCTGIYQCSDQRRRHDRRIQSDLLRCKRQGTANQFCHCHRTHSSKSQCNCKQNRIIGLPLVHQHDTDSIHNCKE